MNKKEDIIKELKEIAPKLAELQHHIKVHTLDDASIEKLISKTIQHGSVKSKGNTYQLKWMVGIAASFLLLVGALSLFYTTQQTSHLDDGYVETYVDENLDDFEDYIINELGEVDDLADESAISEELIITYFEESFDELDLEFFYE